MIIIRKSRAVRLKPTYFNDRSVVYRIEVEFDDGTNFNWRPMGCIERTRVWNPFMKRTETLYPSDNWNVRYPNIKKALEHARQMAFQQEKEANPDEEIKCIPPLDREILPAI